MNNFTFYSPTYFAFGKDTEKDTGAYVKRFGGSKVLIHYGGGSVVRSGLLDRVKVSLENTYFPRKTYHDITLPKGNYDALRVEIGNAKGQNWWCLLYPNLCFIDAVHAVVPDEGKKELKKVLDEEEYEMVTTTSKFKVKWFFFR